MKKKSMDVLYVEDDASDVEFIQSALKEVRQNCVRLNVVKDGDEAIRYLNRTGGYEDATHPDLVLLDLNLPKINGKDVLREIRRSERLKMTPVVILSTSSVQSDIDDSYAMGASGFITKPDAYQLYQKLAQSLCDYWAGQSAFPTKAV